MKELTAAQGKLRCGECSSVFNAMDALSTKLPNHADPAETISFDSLNKKQQSNFTVSNARPVNAKITKDDAKATAKKPASSTKLWPIITALGLCLALGIQVWLSKDLWFSKLRQPEKIEMLSKKVFSHPSQPEALIITASIKNLAKDPQPFPYLEAKLMDIKNQTIALRRFRPHEYLEEYQPDALLESNKDVSIRLKIQDPPGNRAKHFQFSFL